MRRLLVLLLGAAALAACGGGGGGGEAQTVIEAADQARAESIVLQPSDFADGWTSSPHEEEGGIEVAGCVELDLSDLTVTGDADSEDFTRQPAFVVSSATVFATREQAEQAFESYAREELARCIADGLARSAEAGSGDGVDVGEAAVTDLPEPAVGDRSRGYRAKLTLAVEEEQASLFVDFVFVQRKRSLATVAFASLLQAPGRALREDLTAKVAARMEP